MGHVWTTSDLAGPPLSTRDSQPVPGLPHCLLSSLALSSRPSFRVPQNSGSVAATVCPAPLKDPSEQQVMPQPELMDAEGLCAACKTPLPPVALRRVHGSRAVCTGHPSCPGLDPDHRSLGEEAEFPHHMHRAQPPHLAQAWIQTTGP